jgi:hypothetical protein
MTGTALQTPDVSSDSVASMAFSLDCNREEALLVSNNWVEGKKKILWLPPNYRATSAFLDSIIVLGHSSGRISILGFKEGSKYIQ